MSLEQISLKSSYSLAAKGQYFAFALGLGALIVAGFGFYMKQLLAGFGTVVTAIGALVYAYYSGSKRESAERVKKDQALHGTPQLPKPKTESA